jgi:TonB family protein
MRSDPEVEALLRQLLDSGVAPRYVARLTSELRDHYLDLQQEARRAGVPSDEAAADARERLGQCATIAREFARHPELLSWVYTSPLLAALLRALAGGYVALCMPIRALAVGPDALVRYTAAGAAGAAVTIAMLLSMVFALSPESRTLQVMSSALRVPVEALQPRARARRSEEPTRGRRAESSARGGQSRTHAAAGDPPRSGELEAERATWSADDGPTPRIGPRPAYALDDAAVRIDVPRPDFSAGTGTAFTVGNVHVAPPPFSGVRQVRDSDLRPIVGTLPDYPRMAARLGIEGYVVVEYTVSRRGSVEDVAIVESSHEMFHRAAMHAARELTFSPRLVGGEPVDVHGMRTTIRFLLER